MSINICMYMYLDLHSEREADGLDPSERIFNVITWRSFFRALQFLCRSIVDLLIFDLKHISTKMLAPSPHPPGQLNHMKPQDST